VRAARSWWGSKLQVRALRLHAKALAGPGFGRDRLHSPVAPTPPPTLVPPASTLATADMEGEKYSASLIRLWRVWRTTKEMMNDRVGCACALGDYGLRADSTKGLHDCRR
jgi:hypothetical protein